jgi:DNA-binding NarL/FixJ family response regulator
MSALRHAIITRAIAAGHRGIAIARFLNVSEGIVSRIADEFYRKRCARGDNSAIDSGPTGSKENKK